MAIELLKFEAEQGSAMGVGFAVAEIPALDGGYCGLSHRLAELSVRVAGLSLKNAYGVDAQFHAAEVEPADVGVGP